MIETRNLIVDLENLKYISERIIEYLSKKIYTTEESKKNELQQIIIYLYDFLDERTYHKNIGLLMKKNINLENQDNIELPFGLTKCIMELKPIASTTKNFEQDKKRILKSIIILLNPTIKEENIKELKQQKQKILTMLHGGAKIKL